MKNIRYIYIRKFYETRERERGGKRRVEKKYIVQLRKLDVCPFPECVREGRRRHRVEMRICEQKID